MLWILFLLSGPQAIADDGRLADALLNPGFETVDEKTGYPVDWEPVWGRPTACAYSLGTARTGVGSALITDTSETESHGLRSKRIRIEPGVAYTASVFVKLSRPGGFAVYLEYWDAAGQRVLNRSASTAEATDWMRLASTDKAPAEAVSATVLIYCGSTSTGVAHFDDAALDRTPQ